MNETNSRKIINDTSVLQANFQQAQISVRTGQERIKILPSDPHPRYEPTKNELVKLLHEVAIDLTDAHHNLKALSFALKNEHQFLDRDATKRLQNMLDGFRYGSAMFKNITKIELFCGSGDAPLKSDDCFRKIL